MCFFDVYRSHGGSGFQKDPFKDASTLRDKEPPDTPKCKFCGIELIKGKLPHHPKRPAKLGRWKTVYKCLACGKTYDENEISRETVQGGGNQALSCSPNLVWPENEEIS
jgi:hypothetical protein